MRKISIRNIFKKSESATGKKKNKILIPLLILLLIAGIVYLGYPLVFPDSSIKLSATPAKGVIALSSTVASTNIETIPEVKEKTEFDIELENRMLSYEDKIFVYEPYMPPSNRDPFQKVSTSYFSEETTEKAEEGKEGSVLRFPKPELPPGTKLTGIINSKDKQVAIIVMNGETFIANLYDILLDRYIVKEIKKDEVIIDYNGYFFSVKLGGEVLSDEL